MTTDELRAIAEAATPAPWEYDEYDRRSVWVSERDWMARLQVVRECIVDCGYSESPHAEADAAHIATFHPTRILAMLDVIEAAEAAQAAIHIEPNEFDDVLPTDLADERLRVALARFREVK